MCGEGCVVRGEGLTLTHSLARSLTSLATKAPHHIFFFLPPPPALP